SSRHCPLVDRSVRNTRERNNSASQGRLVQRAGGREGEHLLDLRKRPVRPREEAHVLHRIGPPGILCGNRDRRGLPAGKSPGPIACSYSDGDVSPAAMCRTIGNAARVDKVHTIPIGTKLPPATGTTRRPTPSRPSSPCT